MEVLDGSKKKKEISLVGGCTLLGIGIGMYMDHVASGTLIGIGTGLLLTTLYRMNQKD